MLEKRILLTGANGFLGRHVSARLHEKGYKNVFSPSFDIVDLRDRPSISSLFAKVEPEIVIHLAAHVGGIKANLDRPADFLYDNLIMGMELMDAGKDFRVQKFVQIGSACAYPKYAPTPLREEDIWSGYPENSSASYGLAKRVLLAYGQALRAQTGMNIIHLIPTNLYGPGDNFDLETGHVIPSIIMKIEADIKRNKGGGCVQVWGTGEATREFLYVEDCAEAIVKAVEKYNDPEPVNIGTGDEISIHSLVYEIADMMGYKGCFSFDLTKPNGQPRRCLDVTRAKEKLDFTAKTDIVKGLEKTIDWYRSQND